MTPPSPRKIADTPVSKSGLSPYATPFTPHKGLK
jgi:hypothetical protein